MAKKLLIIHGYSDGATSFTALRDYFVGEKLYQKKDVYFLNYASMDDDATFTDFADKLDADYERLFGGERIAIACHSTGALVARIWLKLRRQRQRRRGLPVDAPVSHLLMFAPANFGSDLATLGQSFLGKFNSTFFNSNAHGEDFLESGKRVLQGLEPASPFQWSLSNFDLHEAGYFGPDDESGLATYPFVFAAGENYAGELQARLVKKRRQPGTDGTVRICGTSLNTRKCIVPLNDMDMTPQWTTENKFDDMAFAVFAGFHHGSIIATGFGRGGSQKEKKRRALAKSRFMGDHGPASLVRKALRVRSPQDYQRVCQLFGEKSAQNYTQIPPELADPYQQFFIHLRDDVNATVDDYFLDFYVLGQNDREHRQLTEAFDTALQPDFYSHSADKSSRVMMVNCKRLASFMQQLHAAKARLVFDITAKPPLPNVTYRGGRCVVFDGRRPDDGRGKTPAFLYPNTTTLVEIVLNRIQSAKLLHLADQNLKPLVAGDIERRMRKPAKATGRARLSR